MKKSIRTVTAIMLCAVMAASVTACPASKDRDYDEPEAEESETEETEAEVSEESIPETSAERTERETEETALPAGSEDDARYMAFFENEYAEWDDNLYLTANNVEVMYAYSDIDGDGLSELLIGDALGVYLIVTETDGTYNVSGVYGWSIQYGATSSEYIANGYVLSSEYNGNNYGGEFTVSTLWRYDGTAKAAVAIARIAGSWDPSNLEENLSKWDLFVAVDENGEIPVPEMFPENPEFVGSTLDYGDNYQFADGERVYNELETEFYEYVGNFRATGDTFASLEWKPVDEML